MIVVTSLEKIYGGKVPVQALTSLTFTIQKGEFVALMGKSGSGKSTLLHQLGLLDTPTSGTIMIDGIDVTKLSDEAKTEFRLAKLGYVFQEYGLIQEFSALENVYFPSMALQKDDGMKRAEELLTFVGLGDKFNRSPSELSGGEQQRVAIARALVNDPDIVFADEPTANLDSTSTEVVLSLFKKLNKELGKTIVMVSHETGDKDLVDRVITLKDGIIITDTNHKESQKVWNVEPFAQIRNTPPEELLAEESVRSVPSKHKEKEVSKPLYSILRPW